MNAPQCLIEVSKDGKMTIRPETLQIVKKINKRLVIVGIAGIYRTGKSYLMNRLAGRGSGFLVTPGVQSSTRGIWMWCLPHPHKSDCVLMLLDTEGLQAIKQKAQVSSKIFSLVVLLSSTLIYNNMGVINQHLLSDLQFITELTNIIQVKTKTIEEKCKNYASFFPDLIWTLRDFTNVLELEGQKCTADQYLEYVLNSFSDSDDEDTEHGSIAKTFIMESFPNQNCFVFEQPATPKLIANCSKLENTSLNLTFLEQSETFCQHIYNKSKVKCICGEEVRNGEVLARFIHLYVNYINSGDIPLYKHAVQTLSTTVNTEMIEKALNNYKQKMRAQSKIPTETKQELKEIHKKNMDETVAIFRKGCFGDNGDAENKLKHYVNEWYQEHCKDNEELSRRLCESLLIRLFKDIEQKCRSKFYAKQDVYEGHQLYLQDRDTAVQIYNETTGLGVMKRKSLDSQMQKEMNRERCILKENEDRIKEEIKSHTHILRNSINEFNASLDQFNTDVNEISSIILKIADYLDKFHKGATAVSISGNVVSAAGGITAVVGACLAPVTFGASLIVSIVGISVSAIGSGTSVIAKIADFAKNKKSCKEVQKMIEENIKNHTESLQNKAEKIKPVIVRLLYLKSVLDEDNAGLSDTLDVDGLAAEASFEYSRLAGLLGSARAVSVGLSTLSGIAQVATGVVSGLFLILDAIFIAQDAKDLHSGAKTDAAKKMREAVDCFNNYRKELHYFQSSCKEFYEQLLNSN